MQVALGGLTGFGDLADPANVSTLLSTGRATVYMHGMAMVNGVFDYNFAGVNDEGLLPAIAATFQGYGTGVIELGTSAGQTNASVQQYFENFLVTSTENQGFNPVEVNVNLDDWTDSTAFKEFSQFYTIGLSFGLQNFAVVFAPNDSSWDISNFYSSNWNYMRSCALLGGGLAIDSPPSLYFNDGSLTAEYQKFVQDEIIWANKNGLRSSVIVSPNGDGDNYLSDTQAFVSSLICSGAIPTQWDVENYDVGEPPSYPNGVGSEDQLNTESNIALWIAQNVPVTTYTFSSNHTWTGSQAISVQGTVIARTDRSGNITQFNYDINNNLLSTKTNGIINTPSLTAVTAGPQVRYSNVIYPLKDVSISELDFGQTVTASVSIVSGEGTFKTNNGWSLVDGVAEISGSVKSVETALDHLAFVANRSILNHGQADNVILDVTLNDGVASTMSPIPFVVLSDDDPSIEGILGTLSITTSGTSMPLSDIIVSNSDSLGVEVATVILSNADGIRFVCSSDGSLSADGTSFTVEGNAAELQSTLANLKFVSNGSASITSALATSTITVSVADGSADAAADASINVVPNSIGDGPNLLQLALSEDAWQGDAEFTVAVNGKQIGSTMTATAAHSSDLVDTIDVFGSFTGPIQEVTITFLNDAYGGTPETDRNLYLNGSDIGGVPIASGSTTLLGNGSYTFGFLPQPVTPVIGQGPDTLALTLSEDAWEGNAEFTISVDGILIGNTETVSALNADNETQELLVLGSFHGAYHVVGINFLNDAYGGTPETDRNLYVDQATLNGNLIQNSSHALFSAGTWQISVPSPLQVGTIGAGSDTTTFDVSEDAWEGNAVFTIALDGTQVGGVWQAETGTPQLMTILSDLVDGNHSVTVNFLNDAYGGTPATDRNLFVSQMSIDGLTLSDGTLALYSEGAQTINFSVNHVTPGDTLVASLEQSIAMLTGGSTVIGGIGDLSIAMTGSGSSIHGGAGSLIVQDSGGMNTILAGSGNVSALLGQDDVVTASTGAMTVSASGAGNFIRGGDGQITFVGNQFSNTVVGGNGSVDASGGSGGGFYEAGGGTSNILTATGGNTTLVGGLGVTEFVLKDASSANYVIQNFEVGIDHFNFQDLTNSQVTNALSAQQVVPGGVDVSFGQTIVLFRGLTEVPLSAISSGEFQTVSKG